MKFTKPWQSRTKISSQGGTNLHVWREGEEYFRQKSSVFLKEFTNLLFSVYPQPPHSPVIYHDLTRELLFPDQIFDNVNSYHVHEHLSLKDGQKFTNELYRVLKPGGILRISVPDLEWIAREYLEYMELSLREPNAKNLDRYTWALYEMIDQATRLKGGGLMLEAIQEGRLDREYIRERYSDVFDPFFENRSGKEKKPPEPPAVPFQKRLLKLTPEKIVGYIHRIIKKSFFVARMRKARKLIGTDPRRTKEAVRWMHDRLSLKLLVEEAGFVNFALVDFNVSNIPGWDKYNLDQSNYGSYAIDPSVYIECKKPC